MHDQPADARRRGLGRQTSSLEIMRIAPMEKVVFYDGGIIFLEQNDIDTALVYFLRAYKLDPDDERISQMLNKFKRIKKK